MLLGRNTENLWFESVPQHTVFIYLRIFQKDEEGHTSSVCGSREIVLHALLALACHITQRGFTSVSRPCS